VHVLNIIQCTNLGGMEQSALITLVGLQAGGHSCEVISLNPVGQLAGKLNEKGIPVHDVNYRGFAGWKSYLTLRRRLSHCNPDAVIFTGHNLMASLAMNALRSCPRLLEIHYHHSGVKREWQWRAIYRAACSQFDAIVFPTEYVRREAEEIYPAIRRISHTVPYSFECFPTAGTSERLIARESLGIPFGAQVIGNSGWLIKRKRFDIFLSVAAAIVKQKSPAYFVIAGDGPERDALTRLAHGLGIGDRVVWLGWQNDLRKFYAAIDILLFNSDVDALGRAPIEALAHGVPVVASVVSGGLCEMLENKRHAAVIDRHDISWLTDTCIHLLEEPDEALKLAWAGREHIRVNYSSTIRTKAILSLLEGRNDTGS
jgi:glycosyltransferase involved in cell wall biosynthesis